MMNRRTFLSGLILGTLSTPLAGKAQPTGKVNRIGYLSPLAAAAAAPYLEAFRQGLRELGYVEGQNFTIESRFAGGKFDRLPELAVELIGQRVDVMLVGSNPGALAAKSATSTIPIVMVTTGDPVGGGLVASLARPGGNLTGMTALGQDLSAKRLELLKEVVPGITRLAVLTNPASPYTGPFLKGKEGVARALGVQLQVFEARDPSDFEKVFGVMVSERPGALMVLADIMFITQRRRIVEFAAKSRLPAVYGEREFVDAGGLMFYGAGLAGLFRHAAVYVDKILRGAKPGDLPIEQPTKFELVINLRTAKALGLTIPRVLLIRADQVIQ